jgi:hypothetical protein
MRTKIKIALLILSFCCTGYSYANHYHYKREIRNVTDQWQKIILPDDLFQEVKPDLSDVRIFGITGNDTIEIPYILKRNADRIASKSVPFRLINRSKTNAGYHFTFETGSEELVNEIYLTLKQQNFDWKISLEGSQNQREWYSILENYRILSIRNDLTDFRFTTIVFPDSNYRFFRLNIESESDPGLLTAEIFRNKNVPGLYRNHKINSMSIVEDKERNRTIIHAKLTSKVPVCSLKIHVSDTIDFYRPFAIRYIIDSVKTQTGWHRNYRTLATGTLNSIEKNEFKFVSVALDNLIIEIENRNNTPLKVDSISLSGYVYEIIARFNDNAASYFLYYGNKNATKPDYDIKHFSDRIPENLSEASLGEKVALGKPKSQVNPLFQSKWWLWGIICVIIVVLSWFSWKMLGSK